jgi:type I restriction enzyme S subunit
MKLGDLSEMFTDGDWVESKDQSSDGIRLIQTGNVGEGIFKDREEKARYISEATFKRLRCTEIVAGDCLISRLPDPVGRSCMLPPTGKRMITAVDCTIVRFRKNELLPAFFTFFSQSDQYIRSVARLCTGTTRNRISRSNLALTAIPVPPFQEQQRIVTILDEAFEGIATARANAEKNLQNARAIFESHLQSAFSPRGKRWVETTLGMATGGVFTGPFGSLLHKRDYVGNGVPLVNPAHITDVGIEPDLRKTVSKQTAKRLTSYIMRRGDIVIGRRGEMGRCALVTDLEDGWLCGTGSFFIKPSNRCAPGYLVRFLRSEVCKRQLEKLAGGAVMPNLSNTALSEFPIALPPLEDQKVIVAKIDQFAEEAQRLATLYERKLVALDALKKSLLHCAFAGELTASKPSELIEAVA